MAYNFLLVMTNTGMRTMEAANLRWRDVDARTDKHDRPFVCINVRGKGKFRELIAPHNVATYLERIRAISKATGYEQTIKAPHSGRGRSRSCSSSRHRGITLRSRSGHRAFRLIG